jgi:uroporphyrinogen-III synthase
MRLLVTRPQPQAALWVQALRAGGCEAEALPLLRIVAAPDAAPLHAAWQDLPGRDLVVFVSPNAVERFFALRPVGVGWPVTTQAAAPGPGSADTLQTAGVPATQLLQPAPDAAQFDSEALWQRLQTEAWAGRRVLIVRGDGGREFLAERLREAGAEVGFVQAYARTLPLWGAPEQALLREALDAPRSHLWLLSSSEALAHLLHLAPGADWSAAQALASHPRIAERARAFGFGVVHEGLPSLPAVLLQVQRLQASAGR